MLKLNDAICVEKTDGYSVFGFFKKQDEEDILIESNHGENMGKEIIIPKRNVSQIIVLKRAAHATHTTMTDEEREDW